MSLIYFWNSPFPDTQRICLYLFVDCLIADPLKADLPQHCKECKFPEIPPGIKEVGVKHFSEKLQPKPLGNLKGGEQIKDSHGLATKKYHQLC